jgi:hypothetical protein
MCGPFAAGLGAGAQRPGRALLAQALYQAGKLATYMFLGVLAATAGARLLEWRRPLGLAAGAVLIAAGLRILVRGGAAGPVRAAASIGGRRAAGGACAALAGLLRDGRPLAALSFGALSGFLPCAPLYAVLLWAAALASPGEAALALLCFGFGTGPALLLAGLGTGAVAGAVRARGPLLSRAAALALLLLGGLALARALLPHGAHAHLPAVASIL